MPRRVKIVCSSDVLGAEAAFASLGELEVLRPDQLTAEAVRDADALVVRSTVRVDEKLLAGSRVRFVGTATAGFDHLAIGYLRRRGIRWTAARGCNREAVADYVVAAYLQSGVASGMMRGRRVRPTVAVIGRGHTGRAVMRRLARMRIRVLANDPPRARRGEKGLVTLAEALRRADVVTLHVPLTLRGRDATLRMVNDSFLRNAPRCRLIINTSRGWIVDPELGRRNRSVEFVMDVWWWENRILFCPGSEIVLPPICLASPHLAGRTLEGMYAGTLRIYRRLCRFLGVEPRWRPPQLEAPDPIVIDGRGLSGMEAARQVTARVLDLHAISRPFMKMAGEAPLKADDSFLRQYDTWRRIWSQPRREFSAYVVEGRNLSGEAVAWLQAAGFEVNP